MKKCKAMKCCVYFVIIIYVFTSKSATIGILLNVKNKSVISIIFNCLKQMKSFFFFLYCHLWLQLQLELELNRAGADILAVSHCFPNIYSLELHSIIYFWKVFFQKVLSAIECFCIFAWKLFMALNFLVSLFPQSHILLVKNISFVFPILLKFYYEFRFSSFRE